MTGRRRSPRTGSGALLLVLLLHLFAAAWATTYLERTPEEMALAADLIFVGEVDAVRVVLAEGEPWTEVDFRIEEWVADARREAGAADEGSEPPRTESLRFLGGALPGGERLTVSGLPSYQLGDRVLIFAYDAEGLASPVAGVRQGSWLIGSAGPRDASGAYLGVPEPGRLQRGEQGAELAEVVEAIAALRESGVVPTEPPSAEEPAAQEAGEEAQEAAEEARPPADESVESELQGPGEDAAEPAPEGEPAVDDPEGGQGEGPAPSPEQAAPPQPRTIAYLVDESAGPRRLAAAVREAAAAWEAAAEGDVRFEEAEAGTEAEAGAARLAYGDAALFGPDALSLTLARGGQPLAVLVNPAAIELPGLLLHELGVLLGLQEGPGGVMASALREGAEPLAPSPQEVASLRSLATFQEADLNRDGVVDFYDLAEFAAAYGRSGVNLPADLNGDGTVDDADLALLEAAYQFLPPAEQP